MEDKHESFPLITKVRLKERDLNGEFGPFVVNHTSHACIIKIVDAFNNSQEVKLGYATIQKDKGLVEPTMKRKNLYVTGTSLRDHLKNKTFNTYELVTDASTDEIKKILSLPKTGLKEVKPHIHDIQLLKKYSKLPEGNENCFFVSSWDEEGAEIEVTAYVDGMKIYISPFGMHPKNRMLKPKKAVFATSIEEDASTRDITINAMYIKLKDSDGENGELLDPRGGMHDLKSGVIHLIEKPSQAFAKNPYLPIQLCNVAARFAEDGEIPEYILKHIKTDFKYDAHILRRYFVASVENYDVNLNKYFENLSKTGLDKKIFQNLKVSDICSKNVCHVLPHNKIIVLAYLLLDNDPYEVENILNSSGYKQSDVDSVIFLIRLGKLIKNDVRNPHVLDELFQKTISLPKSKVKDFLEVMGTPLAFRSLIDQKFNYYKI